MTFTPGHIPPPPGHPEAALKLRLAKIERELSNLQTANAGALKALSMATAWEAVSAEDQAPQFSKDITGRVHVSGTFKSHEAYTYPATKTTIATLPEGFRPAKIIIRSALQEDSAKGKAILRVDIRPNGEITIIENFAGAATNTGLATYLSPVSWNFLAGG